MDPSLYENNNLQKNSNTCGPENES
jgi:hypothetical protein